VSSIKWGTKILNTEFDFSQIVICVGGRSNASKGCAQLHKLPMPNSVQSQNPAIRKLEGFARLSDVERTFLQEVSGSSKRIDPRSTLFAEGDEASGAFLILEGLVCRYKQRSNGRRQILALLIPGDICDLESFQPEKMLFSIETLSSCRIAWIPPDVVGRFQQHPNLARALHTSALVNEETLQMWLMNVGTRTAVERLAHLFCEMYVRHHVIGRTQGQSFELPLRQTDLAEIAGLSGVHVNRSLQELRHKQLIELKNRRLIILDWVGLQALAEFEATYLHVEGYANIIAIDGAVAEIRTSHTEPPQRLTFEGGSLGTVQIRRSERH
jgi:CRP-like cAMP-binding protein